MKFGEKIKYHEILHSIIYVKLIGSKDEIFSKKLYINFIDEIELAEVKYSIDKTRYPSSIRKIVFEKIDGEGIVIGQTRRNEGSYIPGYYDSREMDGEQASLVISKTYTFWVVAIGMNKTVLVPKN